MFVEEADCRAVVTLWDDAERRFSSRLLYPESRAALASAERLERIDRAHAAGACAELERLWVGLEEITLTTELARRAGDVASDLALRGYDAVHLASAEAVLDEDGVMVAADARLVAAARSLGLTLANL